MRNKNNKNKPRVKDIYTVIEFSPRKIKLLQTAFKKEQFINKIFTQDNVPDSEFELVNILEKIIKTNHLKITNLLISLDRSLATVRFIKLPSINEEEIENMSRWQATKLLPYKIDEIVTSHQTISVDENGFSHILLVIVSREIVKKFIDICNSLKLQPQVISVTSEGLLDWYNIQSSVSLDDALALIDIEDSKAELVILHRDKFIFSRSFTLIPNEDREQITKRIIDEVKLSIESYSKQEISQPIKKIVITGGLNWLYNLPLVFKKEFNLQTEFIEQLENVNKDNIKADVLANSSFASVCGFALSQRSTQINLIPQEAKEGALYQKKKKELFKTASLALFGILVFFSCFSFDLYNKKKIISALDKQLEKINPVAKEIQEVKNKIGIINDQLNNENSCIEILREIYRITPKDIYLNTFIFEESSEITLKGTAPTMSLVFSFVPILNESAFFENVQVRYATQRKTQGGELTDFEVVCKLNPVPKSN